MKPVCTTERSVRNTMYIITHKTLTYLFFYITTEAIIVIAVRVIALSRVVSGCS